MINDMKFDKNISRFHNLSSDDFDGLINLIGPNVMDEDTNVRFAVRVRIIVAATWRFLATGEQYY